jgi:glycosyltransferase involved in cell wall biosynthesis
LFLFFGGVNKSELKKLNIDFHTMGILRDNLSLRAAYSAADLFLAPAIQESFGKTLVESMACGTPVVCFDATGPKDIVDHKVNGYKAIPFDSSDMANGINWILNSPDYASLSRNASEKVIRCFEMKVMATQYIDLYKEVLY